jgi:hypothetical protein
MGKLSPESTTTQQPHAGSLTGPGRCDAACPAEARVQVIRSPDQQLSFCQHHFREHMLALITGGWQQIC